MKEYQMKTRMKSKKVKLSHYKPWRYLGEEEV
jgi:hypothetical protein